MGWKEYFRLAETPDVFGDLDEWIRHRLRAIHLKHWRRGNVIYRELRAAGTLRATQQPGWRPTRRRWWKNSAACIHIAFPIRYFDELGIPRLAA